MRSAASRKPKSLDTAGAAQTALAALLTKRDYACAEARQWLLERGAAVDQADALVAEFAARGYLNDARFAERYVHYAARKGQGPVRIARELRERGVSEDAVDAALAAGPCWPELCEDVRRKRFGAAAPTSWAEKGRQARFLQYRGFSADHMRLTTDIDLTENPDDD